MAGPDALPGKKAKNRGDCQWVMPGRMARSRSPNTASNGSPCSGGEGGSAARTSPGSTGDITGYDATFSMYRATHSTVSWPWRRNSSGVMWDVGGTARDVTLDGWPQCEDRLSLGRG